MMHVQDQTSEKGTVRIVLEKSSIQALNNSPDLEKVDQEIPDPCQSETESKELGAQILPHIPFKEILELLGEREVDIKVRFLDLVVDSEAHMVTTRRTQ